MTIKERPAGIKILTGFFMLAGLLLIGIGYVVEGIVVFPLAYCLWSMKKWGWYIVVGVYALGIVINLIEVLTNPIPGPIGGIIISIAILRYIWSKRDLYGVSF